VLMLMKFIFIVQFFCNRKLCICIFGFKTGECASCKKTATKFSFGLPIPALIMTYGEDHRWYWNWSCSGMRCYLWLGESVTSGLSWAQVAEHVGTRSEKQCRTKWLNYLNWKQKGGAEWTRNDDVLLISKYADSHFHCIIFLLSGWH